MVTIDNMQPQKIGEIDAVIIAFLAENPDVMATEIVRNLKLDRSNTSKQIKNLLERGLIINHHKEISVKNQERDTWRLTEKGIRVAKNIYINDPEKHKKISIIYSNIYPHEREHLRVIEALEAAAGDRAHYVLTKGQQFLYILSLLDLTDEEEQFMMEAFLLGILDVEGYSKYCAVLDDKTPAEIESDIDKIHRAMNTKL